MLVKGVQGIVQVMEEKDGGKTQGRVWSPAFLVTESELYTEQRRH